MDFTIHQVGAWFKYSKESIVDKNNASHKQINTQAAPHSLAGSQTSSDDMDVLVDSQKSSARSIQIQNILQIVLQILL